MDGDSEILMIMILVMFIWFLKFLKNGNRKINSTAVSKVNRSFVRYLGVRQTLAHKRIEFS